MIQKWLSQESKKSHSHFYSRHTMLRRAGQGFFFRYQGADWIQIKKQYNQTMKPPGTGELFFCYDSTCRKTLKTPKRKGRGGGGVGGLLDKVLSGEAQSEVSERGPIPVLQLTKWYPFYYAF